MHPPCTTSSTASLQLEQSHVLIVQLIPHERLPVLLLQCLVYHSLLCIHCRILIPVIQLLSQTINIIFNYLLHLPAFVRVGTSTDADLFEVLGISRAHLLNPSNRVLHRWKVFLRHIFDLTAFLMQIAQVFEFFRVHKDIREEHAFTWFIV